MKILALLPFSSRHLLERALTADQEMTRAGTVEDAVAALRAGRFDAFVFDPTVVESGEFDLVIRAVHQRHIPMLIYTALAPVAARRIVKAVEQEAHELVLRRADDEPELIRQKLAALLSPSAPAMLLNHTAPRFRDFPDQLQTVAVGLFARSSLPRWVDEFVKESRFARRTVDRWMQRGGIKGAGRLLDTARLARIWEPLVEQKLNTADVAAACGYPGVRLLVAHTARFTGVSMMEVQHRYTRESFVDRLAGALLD